VVWKVRVGNDNLMSDDGVGFSRWSSGRMSLTPRRCCCVVRGMGRGPRCLYRCWTFWQSGTVGEVIDLVGNATVKGNMIGAAILAAALFPVLLASTPLARVGLAQWNCANPATPSAS